LKSFLQETAEDLVKRYGVQLKGIEIIYPNKRTGFHLKSALGAAVGKTIWSPKSFTIQQYVSKLTKLHTIDKLSLLFELYDSFKRVDTNFSYDFDSFHKLGEIILSDFNEIDNYLVEANQIFTNIKNLHEIDQKYGGLEEEQIKIIKQYWINFSIEDKSREKELFLQLWNILPEVYEHFTKKLLLKSKGYEGLIYKHLIGLLPDNLTNDSDNVKVFIGFNALNMAQKKLFRYLKSKNKAIFYWDNDAYYHNNPIQEAGDFLRKNYEVLSEDKKLVPNNFKTYNKTIKLIGIPGNIGQAKALPELLKDFSDENGKLKAPEKTVIVLPDENMLFPVLHSIPDSVEKLNITMGYPLKNTALYSLLVYFLRIQDNINNRQTEKISIYHKEVLSVLNHPFIKPLYPQEVKDISEQIVDQQMVYVNNELLVSEKLALFETIFTPVASGKAEDATTKLLNLLFQLFTNRPERLTNEKSLEDEYLYHTYLSVKRLHEILQQEKGNIELSFGVVFQFIRQVLSGVRIPFESESTDGLQVMGLIETRNIDFENVIILNANEGVLPSLGRPPSLISESLRHAFDLPVLKYQDAIFAYFFYRLLQRTKNVRIVYDNLGSNNRSGELSRFIYQLELESGFEIEKLQLNQQLKLSDSQAISIKKTEAILSKLNEFIVNKGFSKRQFTATSLDTYLNCSLQFYFKYIASLHEPEQVEEEFSQMEMGIIIHLVMELFYKNIIKRKGKRTIEKSDLEDPEEKLEFFLEKAFRQHLGIAEKNIFEYTGNLLIIKEVIKKYLDYIITYDRKRTPFDIQQLEDAESFRASLKVNLNGKTFETGLKGIIDRIDKKDNFLHVIDYKTGKADKEFQSMEELFLNDSGKRKKAVLQVFLYGLLVKNNPDLAKETIYPGIYDVKNMYKRDFSPSVVVKSGRDKTELAPHDYNSLISGFKDQLSALIAEIFNPDIDFSQTEHEDNCNYCSYRAICGKE
jgi:CRISPR/Cas system-associated exonuclease Cas4 (RecB family)